MLMIRTALAAALAALVCLVAPPAVAVDTVTVAGQTHVLNGTNVYRATNFLVLYTPAKGATTGTNVYGYEAVVIDGKVTKATDGVGNTAIPANGAVLSGHGASRTWLRTYATVGAVVTLPGAPPPPPSGTPTADLVLNPASGPAPLTVEADGSGSRDDVGVTSYSFDWGDGSQTAAQTASTATYTYTADGSYRVMLTVTDNDGHAASTTRTVTVTDVDPPPPNQPPVARLTATPASGAAPLSVTLDGGASTDDKGITGYTFDFGDGSSTVAQPASSAQHSYAAAGTYPARLTVRDQEGATSEATASVTVTSAPPPPPPDKQVVLSFTFDDGYANQVQAADVLTRYGMRGTFYVNSPRIGSGSSTYMSKAQVDHLVAAGHEIGGHTLNHIDLAAASSSEITHQVCDDRAALLGMGYRVTSFAYPFGSTSAAAKQIVAGCGYNSARGVGDLRSPGYGCTSCATANSVPPADKLAIKTNQSVQSDTTLAMLENYVTQAESDHGGWVPLLIHQVCSGCAANAIDVNTFTQFVDWVSKRSGSMQVETVDQVIGGGLQPSPGGAPPPAASSVTVGTSTHAITGTNVARTTDALVRYTPAYGTSTRTNIYGFEAAIVGGVVTKTAAGVGNMAIPSNGYVLSGHGTSRTWLAANAKVGAPVTLH